MIKPLTTERRCHELVCSCGYRTWAELPPEVAQSQFGPRVHAAIGYLTSVHRIGRRGIVEILNTLFDLDLCLGTVCNCIDRVSPEPAPVAEEAREALCASGNLNIYETGWKCQGQRRYLWVFVSSLVVYFSVAVSRGAKVLRSILGETFQGVITSDDHSAYSCYHKNGGKTALPVPPHPKAQGSQGEQKQPGCLPEGGERLHSRTLPLNFQKKWSRQWGTPQG